MPKTIVKKAFAKLDLGIHIEPGKSKDGFFPVSYLDCQLDICDELIFEKANDGIEIICDDPQVPTDGENFIHQVAQLLMDISGKKLGAKITLKKQIPVKAGFGGGSSDGAAAVLGLCELWGIKVSENDLLEFSKKLGKDFYYSLYGGLSELSSVGRIYKIKPIKSNLSFWAVVVVPLDEKPSTGWIYENLDTKKIGYNFDKFKKLKRALVEKDKRGFMENLVNDFEDSVSSHFPVVLEAKGDLADAGVSGKLMAGAGLSVVGFFDSQKEAEAASNSLRKNSKYRKVFISRTIL